MVLACLLLQIFIGILTLQSSINGEFRASMKDWRSIEVLAETNPFILALLNKEKQYTCTGSVIDKRIAITSGSCVSPKPRYTVVGVAVFSAKINKNNIFDVVDAVLHHDYSFKLKAADPNVTKIHSNIGLVFVSRPILDIFTPAAEIGDLFATELKEKKLNIIGYGPLKEFPNVIILQQQFYHPTPCSNPKWYYCICGMEYLSKEDTYLIKIGQGAPALFDSKLVGISVAPRGLLTFRRTGVKYNIFTVLGPYLPWIQKNRLDMSLVARATTHSGVRMIVNINHILIFVKTLLLIKVIN